MTPQARRLCFSRLLVHLSVRLAFSNHFLSALSYNIQFFCGDAHWNQPWWKDKKSPHLHEFFLYPCLYCNLPRWNPQAQTLGWKQNQLQSLPMRHYRASGEHRKIEKNLEATGTNANHWRLFWTLRKGDRKERSELFLPSIRALGSRFGLCS